MKVYDKCRVSCIVSPTLNMRAREVDTSVMAASLTDNDRECGKNCLRKHDKLYKLYVNMESNIMQGYCEANDINPEDLYRKSMLKM